MFRNDGEIPEALAKRKIAVDPILANGLKFDAYDLVANRNNDLTERQQNTLMWQRAGAFWGFMFFAVLGNLALAFVLDVFIQLMIFRDNPDPWPYVFGFLFMLILLISRIILETNTQYSRINKDMGAGIVAIQTGTVILDMSKPNIIKMNDEEFNISHEGFLRFKHLEHYTIYYTPYAKIIVSAEPAR